MPRNAARSGYFRVMKKTKENIIIGKVFDRNIKIQNLNR